MVRHFLVGHRAAAPGSLDWVATTRWPGPALSGVDYKFFERMIATYLGAFPLAQNAKTDGIIAKVGGDHQAYIEVAPDPIGYGHRHWSAGFKNFKENLKTRST